MAASAQPQMQGTTGQQQPPDDEQTTDVVVIGTGMGGATIGHRLALSGLRVLFLEKGPACAETETDGEIMGDGVARLAAGRWPERISVTTDGIERKLFLPLGCGAGGSTIFYAAALERFARSDIEPLPHLPHPTGGWPVPWPIWSRYYRKAESLFRVAGTPIFQHDTEDEEELRPPPAESETDGRLIEAFRERGLHPYRLHVALGYKPGCDECGGRRCERACKGDASTICLMPALQTGRATLIPEAEVVRIEADQNRVSGVVYEQAGRLRRVNARAVILAAGAYHSPAILLRSYSRAWPQGLANESGLVGRHLMLHANEWFALWPGNGLSREGPRKTIGLRDFYVQDGVRFGSVQSSGLPASYDNVRSFLIDRFERSPFRNWSVLRPVIGIVSRIATAIMGAASTFVMIVEDFGHTHNRVTLDPDNPRHIQISYRIPSELRERTLLARRMLRRALPGLRTLPLQSDVQLNLGHPCGTCRFGDDPASSVLDASCKAHGLANLYVVDASFMPSSGGTNPALTIAANALRVGDLIIERLRAEGELIGGLCSAAVQ